MSCIRSDFVKIAGDSIGVEVTDEVAKALADDIDRRIMALVKDAMLFMHITNRDTLSVDDITEALYQQNMDPLFGYSSTDVSMFKFAKVADNHDIFYVEDGLVELSKLTQDVVAAVPEPTIALHWLAINGTQPSVPQNPTPAEKLQMSSFANTLVLNLPSATAIPTLSTAVTRREYHGRDTAASDPSQRRPGQMLLLQADAVHALSSEQYRCLENFIQSARIGRLFESMQTIRSLLTQGGLAPLVPYLSKYVLTQTTSSLRDLPFLRSLLSMTAALVCSPYLPVEAHLHQLVPTVLTCLVASRIGYTPVEPHWQLRSQAALVLSFILKRFRDIYHTLQPRVTRSLAGALMDASKTPSTWFGCIEGLTMLGTEVVGVCVIPVAPFLLHNLLRMLGNVQRREYKLSSDSSAANSPNTAAVPSSGGVVIGEKTLATVKEEAGGVVPGVTATSTEQSDNKMGFSNPGDKYSLHTRVTMSLIARGVDEVDTHGKHTDNYGMGSSLRPNFDVPWDVTCCAAQQMYVDVNWTLSSLYRSLGLYVTETVAGIYGADYVFPKNVANMAAQREGGATGKTPELDMNKVEQTLRKQVHANKRAKNREKRVPSQQSGFSTSPQMKLENTAASDVFANNPCNHFATSPYIFTDPLITHIDQLKRVENLQHLLGEHLSGYLPSSMDIISQIIL